MPSRNTDGRPSRREVLSLTGGVVGSAIGVSGIAYAADRSFTDEDGDGIPDEKERSESFHRRLRGTFGDRFDGLDPDRRDLLIDARYVGETSVTDGTKTRIESIFRDHGIFAQWLDHPVRYDRELVEERYGTTDQDILWTPDSFYHDVIEDGLKDVALQVIVVPGRPEPPGKGRIYSPWIQRAGPGPESGYVNGLSVGNRAVVTQQRDPETEAKLLLHEIAHLVLCHDDDPNNRGVMGTGAEFDLTAEEWERLRDGLPRIRDSTGFDVGLRPCLWDEHLRTTF